MDAYNGYHQISMAKEDIPKTTFVTDDGIYCYTCMPFGLKNVGVEFQESMNRAFKGLIGKTVKVYVDNIIIKLKDKNIAIADLREVFDRLCKIGMELNPKKCTFSVSSGRCLGYVVSQREIEANLVKIKVIQEMPEPKTVKDVQSLAEKMASLGGSLCELEK